MVLMSVINQKTTINFKVRGSMLESLALKHSWLEQQNKYRAQSCQAKHLWFDVPSFEIMKNCS